MFCIPQLIGSRLKSNTLRVAMSKRGNVATRKWIVGRNSSITSHAKDLSVEGSHVLCEFWFEGFARCGVQHSVRSEFQSANVMKIVSWNVIDENFVDLSCTVVV